MDNIGTQLLTRVKLQYNKAINTAQNHNYAKTMWLILCMNWEAIEEQDFIRTDQTLSLFCIYNQ